MSQIALTYLYVLCRVLLAIKSVLTVRSLFLIISIAYTYTYHPCGTVTCICAGIYTKRNCHCRSQQHGRALVGCYFEENQQDEATFEQCRPTHQISHGNIVLTQRDMVLVFDHAAESTPGRSTTKLQPTGGSNVQLSNATCGGLRSPRIYGLPERSHLQAHAGHHRLPSGTSQGDLLPRHSCQNMELARQGHST